MADYYYTNSRGSFLDSIPRVTRSLIIVNIIFFIATLVNENYMVATFAMFYPASEYFRPWQIVTHMFMHGGVWHIFFNMYSLLIFGAVLERLLGEKKFLAFYFISGLGALALHTGVQYLQAQVLLNGIAEGSAAAMRSYMMLKATPVLGASGAVYGVLIGYAMLFPQSRLTLIFPPITLTAKWWVLIFAGIELFTGVTGTAEGVAHFAHLGGMLIGFVLIWFWRKKGILFDKDRLI